MKTLGYILLSLIIASCGYKHSNLDILLSQDHIRIDTVYQNNGNIKRIIISDKPFTENEVRIENNLDSSFTFDQFPSLKSDKTPRNNTFILFDSNNKPSKIEYTSTILSIKIDTLTRKKSISFQRQLDSIVELN